MGKSFNSNLLSVRCLHDKYRPRIGVVLWFLDEKLFVVCAEQAEARENVAE
jgi:hypothetical protein